MRRWLRSGVLRRRSYDLVCLVLMIWIIGSCCINAQNAGTLDQPEPEVLSIFPLGANRGTTANVEILGKFLEGAYGIWPSSEGISGRVQSLEIADLTQFKKDAMAESTKTTKGHRVRVSLQVTARLTPGIVLIRVMTPAGISNALPFVVHEESVVDETSVSHGTSDQAQRLTVPTVVSGKIGTSGEADFYEIEASKDQELIFEMISKPIGSPSVTAGGFSTGIALFEPSGSWFDEHQVTRLAYSDESVPSVTPTHSLLRYKFSKQGRYFVQATSFSNKGGPEFSYQLRIASGDQISLLDRLRRAQVSDAFSQWQERAFTRRLDVDQIKQLWNRSIQTKKKPLEEKTDAFSETPELPNSEAADKETTRPREERELLPTLIREKEPNDASESAKKLSIPVLLEGTIERPEDVDSFKFKVGSGQSLAFEIETPATAPPMFNPKMVILDETGREFLSNVFRRIARNFTFYAKTIQPKTIFTFELGGEYTLQIRDTTSRVGDAGCQYRVMIRPQIPHIGEIQISADHLNVPRNGSRKLNVTTGQEEGYSGEVAISVEGLPEGITALPGTEVKPDKGINPDEGPKERFLAKTETATILFVAGMQARITERPELIRIVAQPVVNGVLGVPLKSMELPLMVVKEKDAPN